MDRYIFLIIFFLLIGNRCLEKRSGTEFDLNHCDFWRNWNFTNDIALQFDSDEFICVLPYDKVNPCMLLPGHSDP